MMKRPNEGDNNARTNKAIRSKERLSATQSDLDGKIIGSRFAAMTERPATKNHKHKKCGNSANDTFPAKLAETLRDDDVKDAIWWNLEGSVFAMMPKNFTEKVLDKVFQGTKLESFQRKMKRWGFERCFDTSFPRGALVYHHPLFQRDRPELMSKMSAGMNKFARHGVEETLTSSRATEDRHPRIAAHLGQVSRFVPSNPTALASYGLTTVERLGDICPQQPQQLQLHSQLLAAERLRAAATTIRARMQSQVTVRDLCLQRLQESQGSAVVPSDPSYLQYLATRGSGALAADQMFGSQVVPAADVDLSSLSILRLLQVRELLSRARGPS